MFCEGGTAEIQSAGPMCLSSNRHIRTDTPLRQMAEIEGMEADRYEQRAWERVSLRLR